MKTVFLSAPISYQIDIGTYKNYRHQLLLLIEKLKQRYIVFSEIETISHKKDYDQPNDSIVMDLDLIRRCDYFIMYYPDTIVTSALIELGFALANNTPVIIVAPSVNKLPYLAQGVSAINPNSAIIESRVLDDNVIMKIIGNIEK